MFKLKNGDAAPEIELRDVLGNDFKLSDRRGKMVALHFVRGEFCPTPRGEIAYWDNFAHICALRIAAVLMHAGVRVLLNRIRRSDHQAVTQAYTPGVTEDSGMALRFSNYATSPDSKCRGACLYSV